MVEPFIRGISWSGLLCQAQHVCTQVFRQLPELEHVEVDVCERIDYPNPTTTNTFIKRWGRDVVIHENPAYVEDLATNLAWASNIITQTIPGKVKSLHLSAANIEYKRHSISYNPARDLLSVTNLTLDIRGVLGTCNKLGWEATRTDTSGMVRYWAKTINSLPKLVHLQLNGKSGNVIAEYEDVTTEIGCTLSWLLPGVKRPLQSLFLRNFRMGVETLSNCLPAFKSSLKSLVLDGIVMFNSSDEEEEEAPWLRLAAWLKDHMQGTRIRVDHPYNIWDNYDSLNPGVPVSQSSLDKMSVMGMQCKLRSVWELSERLDFGYSPRASIYRVASQSTQFN